MDKGEKGRKGHAPPPGSTWGLRYTKLMVRYVAFSVHYGHYNPVWPAGASGVS